MDETTGELVKEVKPQTVKKIKYVINFNFIAALLFLLFLWYVPMQRETPLVSVTITHSSEGQEEEVLECPIEPNKG